MRALAGVLLPALLVGFVNAHVHDRAFLEHALTLEPMAKATSALRGRFERPLIVIFAVAAFVLVIACANIGTLMLARSFARRHELGVRVALGASRWRLARPLLCETMCIATLGAALGVGLASLQISVPPLDMLDCECRCV